MLYGKFDGPNPPPALIAWMLIVPGSCFILCGWTIAVFMILAGRRLRQRRSRTFCFIVACMECLLMPFGTVLGVFTIFVLNKAPVQQLFRLNDASSEKESLRSQP